jgi:pimeloyl-ACP methyl ester carboxylesterase
MNIYFIPGLGADKKIFRSIRIPEGCRAFYLEWIKPLKNETLQSYSYRLSEQMDTTQPFVIVGLSFGGMLAAEIVNRYRAGRMIILSSVASSRQLPFYYRIAGKMHMHKLVPISLMKSASLMKRLFTAETPEQKAYLKMAIREVDASFIRWALDAIVKWKGRAADEDYIHIHGSKDAVLPMRFCKPTHIIKGGGHLMLLTRNNEISEIIKEYVNNRRRRT